MKVFDLDHSPVQEDPLDGALIKTVNGEEALALHGLDVVNGTYGSLSFIRAGRFVYRPYPGRELPEDAEDAFVLEWTNGLKTKLVFSWDEGGELQTKVYKLQDGRWHSGDFTPAD